VLQVAEIRVEFRRSFFLMIFLMTPLVVLVFSLVYLGMILGDLPFLQVDRTGIALLGAIALVGFGAVSPEAAVQSLHLPTLMLLFAFMVLSAQMRLGGFYAWVTWKLAIWPLTPPLLLGALIGVVAALSAVFSNDIVCLAVAPVLIDVCQRRRLEPMPYLLALACAANVGSAATLIGNPQNMLIGATLRLSFSGYVAEALPPVLLGLLATWGLIAAQTRGRWFTPDAVAPLVPARRAEDVPTFNAWQTTKGLSVAAVLLGVFLFTDGSHEAAALVGAGVLLTSRQLHSRQMLGLVDWELLVLFIGLFVVNHALQQTGLVAEAVAGLAAVGWSLEQPGPLFTVTVLLSNLVSNVPAVMLLLPTATHPLAGPILALASTLAGNLLLVGSIANLIVADAAARRGVRLDWRTHARVGIPVTLATLAISAGWIGWRMGHV
jgi:Na+/H+ antiporter NhaD/arsenite permease-like protein